MNDRLVRLLCPLATIAALIGLWIVAVQWFKVPNYLLPRPEAVLAVLKQGYLDGLFWPHFGFTLTSMLIGYATGCGLAVVFGAFVAESRTFERFVYPLVIGLQSMPKVALAPLIIVWFGFGLESKVVMVSLVCFFPVFINTVVGLRQTNPALLDLMKAFSASRVSTFFRIKLPSAAGHIFAGLQIAVVLSLIGAVVAEFVSSTRGLGHLISAASVNLDVNVMFAALFSLAFLGILGSQLIRYLHQRVVFWESGPSEAMTEQP